mgnify:FL=1
MTGSPFYLLDSDVFITAKNTYYAFDICPGFWDSLLEMHQRGRVFSIDRVHEELLFGRKSEDLVQWVKKQVPASFFIDSDEAVGDRYGDIMLWAQRNTQYSGGARAKFATGADGWLVAFASVRNAVVVTNEQPAPQSQGSIKLPDVCQAFNVVHENIFDMLRKLLVQFNFAKSP